MKTKILETITSMIDRRDHLIYKRLAGEKLSFVETHFIYFADNVLANILPIPKVLPVKIKDAVKEINLLIDSRR